MSENKTKPTKQSPEKFLDTVADARRREDCREVLKMMQQITKEDPVMWGPSIIGFGNYHYKYDSGREGDFFITGFSPRKQNLTLYIMPGFQRYDGLLKKLGKYTNSKSCLYIKKLEDIDRSVLEELIKQSVKYMKDKYN